MASGMTEPEEWPIKKPQAGSDCNRLAGEMKASARRLSISVGRMGHSTPRRTDDCSGEIPPLSAKINPTLVNVFACPQWNLRRSRKSRVRKTDRLRSRRDEDLRQCRTGRCYNLF